jgi:hypothetical protein
LAGGFRPDALPRRGVSPSSDIPRSGGYGSEAPPRQAPPSGAPEPAPQSSNPRLALRERLLKPTVR